jgi:hypothetical protein
MIKNWKRCYYEVKRENCSSIHILVGMGRRMVLHDLGLGQARCILTAGKGRGQESWNG